jgi:hypothetical protein
MITLKYRYLFKTKELKASLTVVIHSITIDKILTLIKTKNLN